MRLGAVGEWFGAEPLSAAQSRAVLCLAFTCFAVTWFVAWIYYKRS